MTMSDQDKDDDKRRDEVLKRLLNTKPQTLKTAVRADKPPPGAKTSKPKA